MVVVHEQKKGIFYILNKKNRLYKSTILDPNGHFVIVLNDKNNQTQFLLEETFCKIESSKNNFCDSVIDKAIMSKNEDNMFTLHVDGSILHWKLRDNVKQKLSSIELHNKMVKQPKEPKDSCSGCTIF